jgi:hypothetical protein
MEYKVVPFSVKIGNNDTTAHVASQVQNVIHQETVNGWDFVSCGNIDTQIEATAGCFGIGAKPASSTSIMVLVFKK